MYEFHEIPRRGAWFEGFYCKHRGADGGIALIPAVHREAEGGCTASLQVITNHASYVQEVPAEGLLSGREGEALRVGESSFSTTGVRLQIAGKGLEVRGELRYGPFTPLRWDIMGPFRLAEPLMQCYHGVVSLRHELSGQLAVNGKTLDFDGGTGYVEADRGRSFPRDYLWTQCNWEDSCVMLSVAEIPFLLGRFKGCICAILHAGREYRLATYLGCRILRYGAQGAEVRQGRYRLVAELLSGGGCPLRAPSQGAMKRIIRENLAARVRYRFWRGNELILDHTDRAASYEYADERSTYAEQIDQ